MLALTRKPGQAVHIGEDITVTVVAISGNNVTLGFEAPRDVVIHRDDIKNKLPKVK